MSQERKIKVLHFLPTLNVGGAETNLLSLLDYFDHGKYEHHLAYTYGGDLEDRFRKKNVILHKLSDRRLNLKNPLSFFMFMKLAACIRKAKVDMLHCHLDLANLHGIPAAKLCGIPVILHLHGQGLSTHGAVFPLRAYKFWKIISRVLYPHASYFIVITKEQADVLEHLGVKSRSIFHIPNGVSIRPVDMMKKGMLENELGKKKSSRFITIGKLHRAKNHKLLMKSFCNLLAQSTNAQLLIVGTGPLIDELRVFSAKLGIAEDVLFLGKRAEIIELLSLCDCFVLPSSWELHPMTVLEAMSAGLPVIATAVGGIPDTVIDGQTGLIVPPENEKALSDTMLRIIRDKEKAKVMGTRGLARVKEQFAQDKVVADIEAIYSQSKLKRSSG